MLTNQANMAAMMAGLVADVEMMSLQATTRQSGAGNEVLEGGNVVPFSCVRWAGGGQRLVEIGAEYVARAAAQHRVLAFDAE